MGGPHVFTWGCKEYIYRDTACRMRRLKVHRSWLPIRVSWRWANYPPRENVIVTDTQTNAFLQTHFLGGGRASASPEQMKDSGSSRKDSTAPTASSPNKALRIASWNVRTMYEAGKSKQVIIEMKRYRLHILGVSETHWIQTHP